MHKVWILDCKSCSAFLTNRGMKAVLLLRPNVPLFSTDALPVNCAAYSSRCSSPKARTRDPPRTCDCLTQTLCCHGCGTPVGYMIVVPCSRCTSSVFPPPALPFLPSPLHAPIHPRSTNGHRFVFHSSEITAEERLYISGEPGVVPDLQPHQEPPMPLMPVQNLTYVPSHPRAPPSVYAAQATFPSPPQPLSWQDRFPSDTFSPHPHPHPPSRPGSAAAGQTLNRALHLPTPPPDTHSAPAGDRPRDTYPFDAPALPREPALDAGSLMQSSHALFAHARDAADRARRLLVVSEQALRLADGTAPPPAPPLLSADAWYTMLQRSPPAVPMSVSPAKPALKSGDVLYWHHLAQHGELPGVKNDVRARSGSVSGVDLSGGPGLPSGPGSRAASPRTWCAR